MLVGDTWEITLRRKIVRRKYITVLYANFLCSINRHTFMCILHVS